MHTDPKTSVDRRSAADGDLYRRALNLQRIGTSGALKAQEENRRLGIPNAYMHNGQLYYELPSGELTTENPFEPLKRSNSGGDGR
ncbi:MAG: hypothetical protein AAF730_09940 [Bacteroidota bacterium]